MPLTRGPYRLEQTGGGAWYLYAATRTEPLALIGGADVPDDERAANAELILRAFQRRADDDA